MPECTNSDGHEWDSCRCKSCHTTRDTNHQWQEVLEPGGCQACGGFGYKVFPDSGVEPCAACGGKPPTTKYKCTLCHTDADPVDLEALLTKFGSDDAATREAALAEFTKYRDLLTAPLLTSLSEGPLVGRVKAAKALGLIGDVRAVEPLLNAALSGQGRWLYDTAMHSLSLIGGDHAAEALARMLSTPGASALDYERVVATLAKEGVPRNFEALLEVVERRISMRDFEVWRAAVEVLGQTGDQRMVRPLMAALKGSYEQLEQEAEAAKQSVPMIQRGGISYPRFEGALVALKKSYEELFRRAEANIEKALLNVRGAEAARTVIASLESEREYGVGRRVLVNIGSDAVPPLVEALSHHSEGVRRVAANALGAIGDPRAVDPLITSLRDESDDVRVGAVWALGSIGDNRAVGPLAQALSDTHKNVREAATRALAGFGGPEVVGPLITALAPGSSFEQRVTAAEALGEIGDARAVDQLIVSLSDASHEVCLKAAEALGKVGSGKAVRPLLALLGDCRDVMTAYQALTALRKIKLHEPEAVMDGVGNLRRERAEELPRPQAGDPEWERRGALEMRLEFVFIENLGAEAYKQFYKYEFVTDEDAASLARDLSAMFRINIPAERLQRIFTLRALAGELYDQIKEDSKWGDPCSYLDLALDTL